MSERIEELDGWRAISIACVIVGHFANFALLPPGAAPFEATWPWLGNLDDIGVRIFFCISGFIITRLALAERAHTGQFSIGRFWIRRTFRIVPALALYVAVIGLLLHDGRIVQTWDQTLRGAAFMCNLPGLGDCGWFAGHLWSLAVEEQFYLLFPLLFATMLPRRLAAVVAIGWLALACFPTLAAITGRGGRGLFANPFTFLLAGVLLALFERDLRRRLAGVARPAWWLSMTVIGTALLVPIDTQIDASGLVVRQALWLLTPPAICLAIAVSLGHSGRLGHALRQPLLQTVGRMSYSLYLWQQLWLGWPALYPDGSWLPGLALLPLTAWLSWRWIETPMARRGARLAPGIPVRP